MQETIDLIELINLLWRRGLTLVIIAVCLAVVTLLISFIIPKQYAAETSILIAEEAKTQSLSGFTTRAFGMAGLSLPTENSASYSEILNSRFVFLKVIDKFDLRKAYGFAADKSEDLKLIEYMKKRLTVSPIRDNVLHLKYVGRNPERTAEIANYFIEQLKLFLETGTSQRAVYTKDFIEEQIGEIKKELETAETQLKDFSASEEAAGIDEQITQMVRNSADLQAKQTQDKIDLEMVHENIRNEKKVKNTLGLKSNEINEKYKEFEGSWKKPGNLLNGSEYKVSDLSDLPDALLTDTAISQLRTHLTDLKVQLLAEKITKTEKHPSVIKLNDEIAKTRSLFMNEASAVMDSKLATLEFERINLESQIAAYDKVLSDYENLWKSLPEKSMNYIRLKRDVEALSQVYLMMKQQLAETKIDVVREGSYFEVLDPALVPHEPDSPRPLKNAAIGFIFGLVLGVLWIYFSALNDLKKQGGRC